MTVDQRLPLRMVCATPRIGANGSGRILLVGTAVCMVRRLRWRMFVRLRLLCLAFAQIAAKRGLQPLFTRGLLVCHPATLHSPATRARQQDS